MGAVAGLGGVALGAATTYFTQERNWVWQERQWVRQSRLKAYGDFIAECRLWFAYLLKVAFTIRKGWDDARRQEWWDKSNAAGDRVQSLSLQVDLLASKDVASAAADLVEQLAAMNVTIYGHGSRKTNPDKDEIYEQQVKPLLDRFVVAAGRELGGETTTSTIRLESGDRLANPED